MHLQAKDNKDRLQSTKIWGGAWTSSSLTASEGISPADTLVLDFQPLEL